MGPTALPFPFVRIRISCPGRRSSIIRRAASKYQLRHRHIRSEGAGEQTFDGTLPLFQGLACSRDKKRSPPTSWDRAIVGEAFWTKMPHQTHTMAPSVAMAGAFEVRLRFVALLCSDFGLDLVVVAPPWLPRGSPWLPRTVHFAGLHVLSSFPP
jgi:hypothetical protein